MFLYHCIFDASERIKHAVLSLGLLILLTACTQDREQSAEFYVFGSIVEVKLWSVSQADASQAFSELQQMFQNMHRDWHAWEPGRLTEINAAFASGRIAKADKDIIELVRCSQFIEEQTEGRFNPAIGGLISLWGFHTSDYPIEGPPPTQSQINEFLKPAPSSRDIHINGFEMHTDNSSVQLDFGGIAKGYAVDLSIELLSGLGIHNAIVNAGGDLRAIGSHGNRPWRVAIRRPGDGNIGNVEVRGDEAIFTSGNYERFRQHLTRRYAHILDPRTGWPTRDISSVTVIANKGLWADAAATALVVAGLQDWPEVAGILNLDQVAVVDETGTVYLTSAMQQRIQFSEGVKQVLVDIADYNETSD